MLVRRALIGRGRLVADERQPRIKGQSVEAGIDDRMVLGRAAHHGGPDKEARLERVGRRAVAVAVPPVIGVREDVGAALQFGIDPLATSDSKLPALAVDAVARQEVANPPGLVDRRTCPD